MKRWRGICLMLAVILMLCVGVSCRDAGEKVLFKVGKYPVTVEEYTYFYYNCKASMEAGGEAVTRDAVHENALAILRQKYAYQTLADDNKLALTDEEESELEATYNDYVSHFGSEEAFLAELEQNHLTDRLFRALLRSEKLEEKLQVYLCDPYTGDILADDPTVEADLKVNFMRASQILILHEEGDDLTENHALAVRLCEEAKNGADFEALVKEYNEDTYMDSHDGYYFTTGQLLAEFENTVTALAEGEVSDVVFSELGYHVIKRLPMEEDYIDRHFEELRTAYRARVFHERIDTLAASLEVSYYDRFYETEF